MEEWINWQHVVPSGAYLETKRVGDEIEVTCKEVRGMKMVLKENLVKNGSFGEGFVGWRKYTDEGMPVFEIDSGVSTDGSLRITGNSLTDRGRCFTIEDIHVKPGSPYLLQSSMMGDFVEGTPRTVVNFWNGNVHLGTHGTVPQLMPTDYGWRFGEAAGMVAPAGTTHARVECRIFHGLKGSAWWDNIVFGELVPEELTFREKVIGLGDAHQLIFFNPNASLQKKIVEDGFVPNSNEIIFVHGDIEYVMQRAEIFGEESSVRYYYAPLSNVNDVRFETKQ